MPGACPKCLGRSWIVIDDSPQPCPKCKPSAEDAARAFEASERTKRPAVMDSFSYVDGPAPTNAPPNSAAVGPLEVGFTQEQIDRQNQADLAAALASGMGRKRK